MSATDPDLITETTTSRRVVDRRPAADEREAWQRRISYFMLVRLVVLAGFTGLIGLVFYAEESKPDPTYSTFVWSSLIAGYALTIIWARFLPRVTDLSRFATVQTATDILLSAVVVQMTGGVDSGFVSLYLISVLGAAVMGGPRQTWAAAGACLLILLAMSGLEATEAVRPLGLRPYAPLPAKEHWLSVARTAIGIVGVTVLSSYLNTQLSTSADQVERLRALNENIVRSLNSGLVTTDLDGRLRYFNPTAREILDLADDHVGEPVEAIIPGLGDLPLGGDQRNEVEVTTPVGRRLNIGLSKSELFDTEGAVQGYVVNFQDLTRLHDLAQQVRRNERLAALGGLAASVAHEIRNPLAAISGSAELLATAELGEEDQKLLGIIHRESTRLSTLITDLLAFTRPRRPEQRTVKLAPLVNETVEAFRSDASSRGVHIDLDADDSVDAAIDGAQIRQVLWNLMRNAAEATSDDGRIILQVFADDAHAFIVVQDDGEGISTEHLESIFDPFFTTKESGTGFGLAIVHRIVEDNGGSISATSTVGKGAKFTIRFPRKTQAPDPSDSGVLQL